MASRKKPNVDESQVYSTTEWARRIHGECADVLQILERDFGFQITESKQETAYVTLTAQNSLTFVAISWDPRDGFIYWIGPTQKGNVPNIPVHPNLKDALPQYEIDLVAAVKTDGILPTIRGKNNSTLESLSNAITYLVKHAADLLQGDWSCREALDARFRKQTGR